MKLGTPLSVSHLPIVMDILRRSKVFEVIDHAVVDDRRSKVSTSECMAVMLCSVFSGAHDLWRVREWLERYDMPTVMQDAGFDIQEFPEERLAKALDDLWSADVNTLMTSLAIQVIEGFQLDTGFCHFDTTSLSFYGGYEREEFGSMTEDMPPAPHVTYGYSKSHRGDLKQIMYGTMLSADGGIPLVARGVDGNRSDHEVAAEFFTDLRKVVADPREVCCVADSKGWCARTVGVVHDHGMRLLSRLPRGTLLHRELIATSWAPTGRVESPGKRLKDAPIVVTYQGFDKTETLTRIVEEASSTTGPVTGKTTDKATVTPSKPRTETFTIPMRVVKIRSTDLLRTKMATARRMGSRERVKAEKLASKERVIAYACQPDAEAAAARLRANHGLTVVDVLITVERHSGPFVRPRGRPPKHAPALVPEAPHHFRLTIVTQDIDDHTLEQRLIDDATIVLIRTANDGWNISDADMIAHNTRPVAQ